jgi:hypothetical protein
LEGSKVGAVVGNDVGDVDGAHRPTPPKAFASQQVRSHAPVAA